ncbi:MAG: DUF4097 family beta strand repeat-containing protein [Acidobacteriia bacterium]|nr:DUF4097 family beta strand repeat-containing protein [Terriglobia bacterium]
MASPVQVPPPRQRRSFAGPLVLIVVGTCLLLANMGVLQWHHLGLWFARFWPLLIILWGIVKLIEYQQAQKEGVRPRGIGAGGVFLLIVLIVFGMAASQAARFNWKALQDEAGIDDNNFVWFGENYNYDDQLQQAFPANSNLHIVTERGAVNLNASTDDQIHVSVHKRITAENQSDADKWNAGTKPQISVSGQTITLNANTQGAGDHRVTTDMDVAIPRKASVVISSRHGDVSVMGRDGDLEISHQHGSVSTTDINGKVALSLHSSSARVSQVSGDVSVDGGGDDISLEDIKGAAHVNGEFDSLKFARVASTVGFKSARTDMEFAKLNGDLDMDSGDLRASDVVGPFRLRTRSKDVRLNGISGDVRLQDENSSIELRVSKLGSMQVENRKGDIQIYLPEKAAFQLDARTQRGEIQSDFAQLKINNDNENGTASGSVGENGPHLVVTNDRGTIELRKGSVMVEAPAPPTPPNAPKAPHLPAPKAPVQPTEN